MPLAVGVPLMVIVLPAQAAVTPEGNPVAAPIPVAPVVVWVILVIAVLIHAVGDEDAALTVLSGVTVISISSDAASPLLSVTVTVIKYVAAVAGVIVIFWAEPVKPAGVEVQE